METTDNTTAGQALYKKMLWLKQDFESAKYENSSRLLMYILVVVTVFYLAAIFGITFTEPKAADAPAQDVTMAVHITQEKVEKADFFAQGNQKGAGIVKQASRMTASEYSPFSGDTLNKVSPSKEEQITQQEHSVWQTPIIYARLSWEQVKQELNKSDNKKLIESQQKYAAQMAQIASLEAEFSRTQQEFTKKTNEHTVDSITAQEDRTAEYMTKFRQRIEAVGNQYYPAEAKQDHLQGDVRLKVVLKPDGTILAIRLMQSSGSGILDEAAKDSVRRAAPFGAFTDGMRDYTQLSIIRTWRYTNDDNVSVEANE